MRSIVIIPTYNERLNIENLIRAIRDQACGASLDILVVDSASPDKTAELVKKIQPSDSKLFLIEQKAKLGLGKAYLEGMAWVLSQNYDVVITMDADFSHNPQYLNTMLQKIEGKDLIVGSRYVQGGGVENWPWFRIYLSSFANWYARTLLAMPVSDLTSGFQCFRAALLKKILSHGIRTEGYAFLVELKSLAILEGARYFDIPIIFQDRTHGDSKISKRVIFESAYFVLSQFLRRLMKRKPYNISRVQSGSLNGLQKSR